MAHTADNRRAETERLTVGLANQLDIRDALARGLAAAALEVGREENRCESDDQS